MIIDNVKLNNFRSHKKYELKCDKMTSLILGANGSGKTSVLEAIYLATRGKSFRATDKDIVKRDEKFYRVELNYHNGEKTIVIYDGQKRTFEVGDKKVARLPKKNRYPVVLFEPDDLNLVDSSPTHKRDYFDRFFCQLFEEYNIALLKYNKALKQRNEALKSENLMPDAIFSWDILLAKYGCLINQKRHEFLTDINQKITDIYHSIAENEDKIQINYISQCDGLDENAYFKKIEQNFEKDRIMGHTIFGVHRDDYEFIFNDCLAEGSASRGEVRSIILAIKFIEASILHKHLKLKPIILLDDVFSELDEKRQKCLVKNFKDNQVIITSVDGVVDD